VFPELVQIIVVFAAALFFLIKSADYLVRYSEKLGLSLGVPQFIVGVTLISAGTSLPELVTSIFSIGKDEAVFVAGNVVGSNIANILLVLGVTLIIAKRVEIKHSLIRLDLPLLAGSTSILILTMMDGIFTFKEAVLSIIGFIIYILYNVWQHKERLESKEKELMKVLKVDDRPKFKWYYLAIIAAAAIVLYFSAEYTVESVIQLAGLLSISTSVVAITAVAIGTSLPELIVSAVAAKKGNLDMALGNVLGSNIFNGFMVMGVSGMISPLPIDQTILTIGIPFLIVATIFLVFSGIERKFYNFEGALYLIIYILFIGQLFNFI
jgi:cation:H+ antiporter